MWQYEVFYSHVYLTENWQQGMSAGAQTIKALGQEISGSGQHTIQRELGQTGFLVQYLDLVDHIAISKIF